MATDRRRAPYQRLFDWIVPIVTLALGVAAPIIWDGALSGKTDWYKSPWALLFGAVVIAAAVLTFVQGAHSTRRDVAERQGLAKFNSCLTDTIKAFADLVDSKHGNQARDAFLDRVVSDTKSVMPLLEPRICVYELEGRDESEPGQDSPDVRGLTLVTYGGRGDRPRPTFTSDTKHGAAAIQNALGYRPKYVDNPADAGFAVDTSDEPMWKSFIAVPLEVGGEPRGLMTIDTKKQTRFTDDHMAIAMTIARLIEIGMAKVEVRAQRRAPNVASVLTSLGEPEPLERVDSSSQTLPVESTQSEGRNHG